MTILTNNCEGAANGTAITTGNSDDNSAGDALNLVFGTATMEYDTAWDAGGATSWRIDATAEKGIFGWSLATDAVLTEFDFRLAAVPGSTTTLAQVRNGGNGGVVQLLSNGKLYIADDSGAAKYVSSSAVVAGATDYRLKYLAVVGDDTSSGTIEVTLYAGGTDTVLDSFTTTTANNGTASWDYVQFGVISNVTVEMWVDNPTVDDTGGFATATGTTAQAVLVDTSGSVGSLALTQDSGTTATITGPTAGVFTIERPAGHADTLEFTLTATGAGPDATMAVTIPPDNINTTLVFGGGDATDINDWD